MWFWLCQEVISHHLAPIIEQNEFQRLSAGNVSLKAAETFQYQIWSITSGMSKKIKMGDIRLLVEVSLMGLWLGYVKNVSNLC